MYQEMNFISKIKSVQYSIKDLYIHILNKTQYAPYLDGWGADGNFKFFLIEGTNFIKLITFICSSNRLDKL